jgi:hypothetical protein
MTPKLLMARERLASRLRPLDTLFSGQLKYLLLAFVLWRGLLYLGVYVGSNLTAANPAFAFPQPLSSIREFLLGAWLHWDADWYRKIIQHGYSYEGPGIQANVAFFPLYPTIVYLLVRLFGFSAGNTHAVLAVGILVSNLSALLAMLMLYLLAKFEFRQMGIERSEVLAFRAALLFLFFPTSLFFATLYTEALYAFLIITSFYFLRHQRFLWAGLFGALASMCRVNGILLLIPMALEYLRQWKFRPRVPMGLALFSGFLFFSFDDPLAFVSVQSDPNWHGGTREDAPFFDTFAGISTLLHHPENALLFVEVAYAASLVVLAVLTLRYLPLSYGVYTLVAVLFPLSIDLTSIQRYGLTIFPVFITLGLLNRSERIFTSFMALFAFLLSLNVVMWINALWVG